ncbi:MAG: hypothetical protein JWL63_2472 [Rhodocyclales bacterium]|nr:hypothetical protein [Rhodocyclales bacterium]
MPLSMWLGTWPGSAQSSWTGSGARQPNPRMALPASPLLSFLAAIFLALAALAPAHAAVLAGGRFVEADGWKARITVDCLLKDKLCGSFRYETQGCEGDLIYTGETAGGFEFRAELRAGRCLPGCTVQVSSDFKRYAEICKDSRHDGTLVSADPPAVAPAIPVSAAPPVSASDTAPATTTPVPATVVLVAPTITSAQAEVPATPAVAPAPAVSVAPGTAAGKGVERVERTGDSTMKGDFTLDSKTGTVSGKVRIDWDNGNSFDGTMINGKRNGKGRFVWSNGQSYDGDWRDDVADGNAVMVFANGDRYQGQVKDGVPDGRGRKQFSNGDSYEGQFTKGVADIEGTYTEKSGSRYSGQWKAGIKNGRGRFAWIEGQSYEGEWVADKPEGKGVISFANGDRYDGQISNGLPQGMGVKTYASSQDRYEGNFMLGEAQGEGVYRWKNGDAYDGNWLKGKKAGQGRYTWTNGDYWEGVFTDDRQTEAGRLYFTPTIVASGADVEKVAKQTNAMAAATDTTPGKAQTGKPTDRQFDHTKLLAIPMVAKELRDCSRKDANDCATRVVNDVVNDALFPHKWQIMSSEKDPKGKASVFEVDTNSVLEAGNVFSWLRSGDGMTSARNIGIKYDCRAQSLEIQLIYNCSGSQLQTCVLDPSIEKYAGKVIPATDIKSWFKGACER